MKIWNIPANLDNLHNVAKWETIPVVGCDTVFQESWQQY